MPLYTRDQLADLCGMNKKTSRAYISTYIKRGKIILSGDYIDDSVAANATFIQKELEKNKLRLEQEVEETEEVKIKSPNVQAPSVPAPKIPNVKDPAISVADYRALEAQKKALDIEKIQEEIEILRVKKDKMHGVVIPTELVRIIFTQHSKAIVTEFKNTVDGIITKISKKKAIAVIVIV